MRGEVLLPAHPARTVSGPILRLAGPISFWGGVSPEDGRLSDPRSAQHGALIAGTVLCIAELRGSSSASSVLLELIYKGLAPAAIVLDAPDAILALGAFVAREMGWPTPVLIRLSASEQANVADGILVRIDAKGRISADDGCS